MLARAAGELAPPLEVLNVVEQGAVPIGHTASYYYVGKSPVTAFGTALPFGLTARQQNAWLYEGGGLQLMQETYAAKFGVIQFPADPILPVTVRSFLHPDGESYTCEGAPLYGEDWSIPEVAGPLQSVPLSTIGTPPFRVR